MSYHPYGYRPSYRCDHCGHAHSTPYCPKTGAHLKAIGEGPLMWLVEGGAFFLIHCAISIAFIKPLSILAGDWLFNVWWYGGCILLGLIMVFAIIGSASEKADDDKHKKYLPTTEQMDLNREARDFIDKINN